MFDAFPADMNATHQATGSINSRAFIHNGTSASYIFPTFSEFSGTAINADAVVAGHADNGGDLEAFKYDGAVQFLGTLGGANSNARDINDAGDIVGSADTAGGQRHAFLYRDGVMTDLHTLAGTTSDASRINEAGTVIGSHSPSSGTFRGFVSDGMTMSDLGTLGAGTTSPYDLNELGVIVGTSGGQAFRYVGGSMTASPLLHDLERCHRDQRKRQHRRLVPGWVGYAPWIPA